ncbi:MAG: 3alpha(or 20beta)-hydroxysteroid dehydrogenase [Shewanella sp.]|jgi:3alpha(or 20beta)-hydroxysteroid dehydrogenase
MGKMVNKVVIVTGAASGIGAECSALFAAEGASVVVADMNDVDGKRLALSLPSDSEFFGIDITQPTGWVDLMAFVIERFGKLNVLVNCAGISLPGDIESTDFDLWRKVNSINLDGTYLANHYAIKAMKGNGEANAIVNISSAMSLKPHSFTTAYCASKAGVDALTKCVALHCGQNNLNIRCNSVHPGAIHTPMLERYLDMMQGEGTRDEAQAMFDANHPLGRCGEASDIAQAVLYLASDDSKFVTGSHLAVDGGQSIS